MLERWHRLKIVGTCAHDDGYNQTLFLWVNASTREKAVAKAMIDDWLIADATLQSVLVVETRDGRPDDFDKVYDPDRD